MVARQQRYKTFTTTLSALLSPLSSVIMRSESFSEDQSSESSLASQFYPPYSMIDRRYRGEGGDLSQYLEIIEKNMPSSDRNRQMWSLKLPLTSFVSDILDFSESFLEIWQFFYQLAGQQQLELVKIIKTDNEIICPRKGGVGFENWKFVLLENFDCWCFRHKFFVPTNILVNLGQPSCTPDIRRSFPVKLTPIFICSLNVLNSRIDWPI